MTLSLSGTTRMLIVADATGMPTTASYGALTPTGMAKPWPDVFPQVPFGSLQSSPWAQGQLHMEGGQDGFEGLTGPAHILTTATDASGVASSRTDVLLLDAPSKSSLQPVLQRAIAAMASALATGLVTLLVTGDVSGNFTSAAVGYAGWNTANQYGTAAQATWTPSGADQITLQTVLKSALNKLITTGGL